MNDDYDDMNCCSEYFYIRYADESTLIDLSMLKHPYPGKDEDSLNSNTNQSFFNRIIAYTKSHPSWFGILILILCSFLIIHYFIQSKINSNLLRSSY